MNTPNNQPLDVAMPKKRSFWNNKINYHFRFCLQKKGDADVILRLAQEENRSAFIRNAVRYYIQHEDEILKEQTAQ